MRWLVLCLLVLVGCEPIPDEPDLQKEIEKITTLGYLVASEPAPERSGVTVWEPEAYEGYTLFTLRTEPTALLIDMGGNVVRRWHVPGANCWTRARLLSDGGLVVITRGPGGMLKLDPDGNPAWLRPDVVHHDFGFGPDEHIYTLVSAPGEYPFFPAPIIDNCVVELDRTGHELRRVSIAQAFLNSPAYRNWLDIIKFDIPRERANDIFHTNSVQVLTVADEPDVFILLSIRGMSTVCLLDMAREEIVWAMAGMWRKQHEARLLPNGNMMLFDNLGHEGRSKVIEFDPATQAIVWQYDDPGFFSMGGGSQQLLPNDNVLITECMKGRLFEVTRDGTIVWEYINPMATADSLTVRIQRSERIGPECVMQQ